jgi:hypothetical protein
MANSTTVLTIYQYKGSKLSIILVEEEENSHSDNELKVDTSKEFVFVENDKFVPNFNTKLLSKEYNYYIFHRLSAGEKMIHDNPPEV